MNYRDNSVSLRVCTTYSLKRFISRNSDNCVRKVIMIGDTCIPSQNHVLNVFFDAEFSIINIVSP